MPDALSGGDFRIASEFIQEVEGVSNILRSQPELLDEEIAAQIEARQAARRRRFCRSGSNTRMAVVEGNSAGRHARRRPLEENLNPWNAAAVAAFKPQASSRTPKKIAEIIQLADNDRCMVVPICPGTQGRTDCMPVSITAGLMFWRVDTAAAPEGWILSHSSKRRSFL